MPTARGLVQEGRIDFSTECGCVTEAFIMLDAIKERIGPERTEELLKEIQRSGLPQKELWISLDLWELLRRWNDGWGNAMTAGAPLFDPVNFHEFAGRLAGTNEAVKR